MTKKQIMKEAHRLAHKLVASVGNYSIALAIGLKKIWAMAKAGRKRMSDTAFNHAVWQLTHVEKTYNGPKFVWVAGKGVPEWLMAKNLTEAEVQGARLAEDIEVVRETAKASLLRFVTSFGDITMWAPKSVIKGF